jgi:hypothetical protein
VSEPRKFTGEKIRIVLLNEVSEHVGLMKESTDIKKEGACESEWSAIVHMAVRSG